MKLTGNDVDELVREGILEPETARAVRAWAAERHPDVALFDLKNVGYWFGALIVLLALGWFLLEGWERYGAAGLLAISAGYVMGLMVAGSSLWERPGLRTPGGLLFTVAVAMVPVMVFAFEDLMGWWPGQIATDAPAATQAVTFRQQQLCILGVTLGTALVGLGVLWLRPFAFLAVPPTVASLEGWQAGARLLAGEPLPGDGTWVHVMLAGLAACVVGFLVDRRTRDDYALWLYLAGAAYFWFGLTNLPDNELSWAAYAFVNLLMMGGSLLLQRRTFLVFGALGVLVYLVRLGLDVFEGSLLFPFVLSLVGLAVIAAAVAYQRQEERVQEAVLSRVPGSVRRRLPQARSRE